MNLSTFSAYAVLQIRYVKMRIRNRPCTKNLLFSSGLFLKVFMYVSIYFFFYFFSNMIVAENHIINLVALCPYLVLNNNIFSDPTY